MPLNIEKLKPELQRCLEQHFSVRDQIDCITPLGTKVGLNHERFVKVMVGAQPYGFKTYPEATNKQEDHRKYAEQDLMIAEIATRVKAPSCSAMRQTTDIAVEPFEGWIVNIIKFLPRSKGLNELSPDTICELKKKGETFLYEFGEWLAFTMALGVQDRSARQFVYDGEHLAMIDMDFALIKPGQYESSVHILEMLRPLPADKIGIYCDSFAGGIASMNHKLTTELGAIKAILSKGQYSDLAPNFDPTPVSIENDAVADLRKLTR